MEFQEAVKTGLQKYVVFEGRASRSEFWYFTLAAFCAYVVSSILDSLLFGSSIGLLYTVTVLGLILPSLAVQVRRLHDTGRSGWWVLIVLVPLVGAILLIVWFCQEGKSEDNPYGVVSSGPNSSEPLFKFSASNGARTSDLERLEKLHALHSSGALTEDEFAAEKAKILSSR
ncbi:DUF805 domain-containing protein [Brevundimonas sp.]|uniref:DUF805 domain-containing protein n=1 Tax=Brevundimonas sp. TaxID=1871086 RepID=UPI00262EA4FA|nr:DUF805 domain-containing protein [Brevundimonas sp.]